MHASEGLHSSLSIKIQGGGDIVTKNNGSIS